MNTKARVDDGALRARRGLEGVPGACQGCASKAVEREEGNQGTISSDSASMELDRSRDIQERNQA